MYQDLPADIVLKLEAIRFRSPGQGRWLSAVQDLMLTHPEHSAAISTWCMTADNLGSGTTGPLPPVIPNYIAEARLGDGGFGEVWRAEQLWPVRRQVALKVLKLGMDSRAILARFAREQASLARMNHDAVAKIFDAGTTPQGQSFFAMELVEGLPITRHCDHYRLDLLQRIELFRRVCLGVEHAHQKGIVHRDLKPDNVLVAKVGDQHAPKLIDFGIAKVIDGDDASLTEVGMVIGTPAYMAPEQAAGAPNLVGARTDVYALGAILYELLSGAKPLVGQIGLHEMPWGLRQRILAAEAPRPSLRASDNTATLAQRAQDRRTSPSALLRSLRGDLGWIVLKAMAKSAEDRYVSAADLAGDLGSYLRQESVSARPQSALHVLRLCISHYRLRVLGYAMAGAFLVIGCAAYGIQQLPTDEEGWRLDLLAGVMRYEEVVAREAVLYPPWPFMIKEMEQWLSRDLGGLLAMRPLVEAAERQRRIVQIDQAEVHPDSMVELLTKIDMLTTRNRETVLQRLQFARQVAKASCNHPNARYSWSYVRAAIALADGDAASRLYAGYHFSLADEDVMGLVPIGMNPITKLWEFYHLGSAWDGVQDLEDIDIPMHDSETGAVHMGEETGIVFALLPGGEFVMGSQRQSPDLPNYDPDSREDEVLPHRVKLSPFFVARHELTQGQWARLCGVADGRQWPSELRICGYMPGVPVPVTAVFPVENVDWDMCNLLLQRHGLMIPTEAQWEYGCRGGSSTPWYTGVLPNSLAGHANVLDMAAISLYPDPAQAEVFYDGFAGIAPVGSFACNAFGLYDVHGNVWEWCRDLVGDYCNAWRVGDGFREPGGGACYRVLRGGHCAEKAVCARAAYRLRSDAFARDGSIGVRPARSLRLAPR